jgi:hypothetical protein
MAHSGQRSPNVPVSKRSTKRSITIKDHKTSVSLENEFWDYLREIAVERGVSLGALVAAIDANRQHDNLSSAIQRRDIRPGACLPRERAMIAELRAGVARASGEGKRLGCSHAATTQLPNRRKFAWR